METFLKIIVKTTGFSLIAGFVLVCQAVESTERQITCSYDPQSGKPNPLGMRTFITAIEKDNNSIFVYEQFPSIVSGDRPVTIENKRTLTLYQTTIEEAITILKENPDYYSELVGYRDNEGFVQFDDVFQCQ